MTDRSIADYAREYIGGGLYVNPVYVSIKSNGKKDVRPVGLWRQTSTNSQADVEAWWGSLGGHPTSGMMIDCGKSGLVVIDCDGDEGITNWLALKPSTPIGIVRTQGGGEHWYYQAHPDHVIGNDQDGKVAPSVDVRGLGGLVIAPPTAGYSWTSGPEWNIDRVVPAVVIERMGRPRTVDAPAVVSTDDQLFQPVERTFTEAQAKDWIRTAHAKLAATAGGLNGAINTFAMACAHFPWLVNRAQCAHLVIKALGEREGWTEPDDEDRATINSAYSATEAGRSWTAVLVAPAATSQAESVAAGDPDSTDLEIHGAATMAYWLQEHLGAGRLAGFFTRHGEMVHTPRISELGYVAPRDAVDDNGPSEIRAVTGPTLAAKLQYLYQCWSWVPVKDEQGKRTGEKVRAPALFPRSATQVAVDAPEALEGLRTLRGITSTPMVRADGSLLDAPGYDEASGYLFLPGPGVDVKPIPEIPTDEDVEVARGRLLSMIEGFPFATDDDRANYLGLLLTPMLREVAPPTYKMFGIGAHQPGSGKSLLAQVASEIHGGVLRSEVPEDEAEWRKQGTSILSTTSAPVVVLDNVTGILRSSVLAGLLTAGGDVTDRELGSSRTITATNDRVWVVTGNNLSLGGDLVRRTITILIDPDAPNPEQRTDFAITDLIGWVRENRNEILWALLVLIRAWVGQGMPEPARQQSDSFARWERVIAGVLLVAEIPGAFDDQSGKRAAAGGDDDGLAGLLDHVRGIYGDTTFSIAELLTVKPEDGGWMVEGRDWLPLPVLDKLHRSEAAGRISLGWWFRNRIGRWVTTSDGRALVIREMGMEKKVARWKVEER